MRHGAGRGRVRVPQREGYASVKGGILRPTAIAAPSTPTPAGTIFGSGVGIVLLKDSARAIEDRDHIYAVIRGSAVNNDGADKISFTASSVPGQARAMVEALGVARSTPARSTMSNATAPAPRSAIRWRSAR